VDIPTKQLETEWGTFYATATNGNTVRFRTKSPNPEDPEHRVTLNRLWYSADIEMTNTPPKRHYRHFVDDLWHVDLTDISYRIRRYPVGGAPTDNALVAVRERVLPELAAWLRTPDGLALLDDGATHQRGDQVDRAQAAETVITAALGRVIRMQGLLEDGRGISTEDEALVRHINDDVARLVHRTSVPLASPSTSASVGHRAQAPEAPGL
jgi:hypothetical protein